MFHVQRIVNSFPKNLAIREDPSSFGFRYLSVFADVSKQFNKDLLRLKKDISIFDSNTDYIDSLYEWDVSSHTFNMKTHSSVFDEIVVSGDSIDLERITSSENLTTGLPTRLDYLEQVTIEHTIYSENINTTGSILEIGLPSRLYIEIQDCDSFVAAQNVEKNSPIVFGNIELIGEDPYGNEIRERIAILNNGIYTTTNIYGQLISFNLVNVTGTDGTISIKLLDVDLSLIASTYFVYSDSDNQNRTLYYSFDSTSLDLNYFVFPIYNTIRPDNSFEVFTGFEIFDSEDNQYTIDDITFSPSFEHLFILSGNKVLITKDYDLPIMIAPENARTTEIVIDCEFTNYYPKLNTTNKIYLFLKRSDIFVVSATIKLIDPTGVTWYLQEDKTWSEIEFTWLGDPSQQWASKTFGDLRTGIVCDTRGQWELVIEVTDSENESFTTVKNFLVPYLTIDNIITLEDSYEWIAFHDNGYLYLGNGTTVDIYKPKYDYYYFDSNGKKIYTIENYSSIEVTNV